MFLPAVSAADPAAGLQPIRNPVGSASGNGVEAARQTVALVGQTAWDGARRTAGWARRTAGWARQTAGTGPGLLLLAPMTAARFTVGERFGKRLKSVVGGNVGGGIPAWCRLFISPSGLPMTIK